MSISSTAVSGAASPLARAVAKCSSRRSIRSASNSSVEYSSDSPRPSAAVDCVDGEVEAGVAAAEFDWFGVDGAQGEVGLGVGWLQGEADLEQWVAAGDPFGL